MLTNNIAKQEQLLLIRGNSINAEFDITIDTNVNPLVEFGIRETLTNTDLVYATTTNNKIILIETVTYNNLFSKKYKLIIPYEDTIDLPITDLNNDTNYCNDKYLLGYLQITYDTTKELLLELQVYVRDNYNVFT